MSEDATRNFDSKLLEQIFAKLEVMDTRLQQVEVKIDRRGFDTKPIWERALGEIQLVKEDVSALKEDVAVLKQDVAALREDLAVVKQDVAVLKEDVAAIKNDLRVLNRKFEVVSVDMVSLRAEQRYLHDRLLRLENNESTT